MEHACSRAHFLVAASPHSLSRIFSVHAQKGITSRRSFVWKLCIRVFFFVFVHVLSVRVWEGMGHYINYRSAYVPCPKVWSLFVCLFVCFSSDKGKSCVLTKNTGAQYHTIVGALSKAAAPGQSDL